MTARSLRPKQHVPRKKHLLPRSGSEPTNFQYYKTRRGIIRNNCMGFAFGERGRNDYTKQQPGNRTRGLKGSNFSLATCDELVRRVMSDYKGRVYKASPDTPCRRGYGKVMAFLAPDMDYHFFRQGPDGFWEHKRGLTPATKVDACGLPIVNPQQACRNYGSGYNYKVSCATFCRRTAPSATPLKSLPPTRDRHELKQRQRQPRSTRGASVAPPRGNKRPGGVTKPSRGATKSSREATKPSRGDTGSRAVQSGAPSVRRRAG